MLPQGLQDVDHCLFIDTLHRVWRDHSLDLLGQSEWNQLRHRQLNA